jgi:uncharacterized membrane protein (DUF106 family)
MNSIFVILLFAIGMIALINLFYRFMINQNTAETIKNRIKELNKKARHETDKEKIKSIYSEIMNEQSKLMRMSLKPMLFSFLVILLLLPFIAMNYADRTIDLNTTNNITINERTYFLNKSNNTLYIDNNTCELPCRVVLQNEKWIVTSDSSKLKFSHIAIVLPFSLPLLGSELGWIWWYLIVTIPTMIIIRKLYGIKV